MAWSEHLQNIPLCIFCSSTYWETCCSFGWNLKIGHQAILIWRQKMCKCHSPDNFTSEAESAEKQTLKNAWKKVTYFPLCLEERRAKNNEWFLPAHVFLSSATKTWFMTLSIYFIIAQDPFVGKWCLSDTTFSFSMKLQMLESKRFKH